MKKIIYWSAFVAVVFISCKKEKIQPPTPPAPTATTFMISQYPNQTLTPPKTMFKTFEGDLYVGKGKPDFFINSITMMYSTTGGAISNYKNARFQLLRADGSVLYAPSVVAGTLSANIPLIRDIPLIEEEKYIVSTYADMTVPGFIGAITTSVRISYDWDSSGVRKYGSVTVVGQTITFSNPTLTTAVSVDTPEAGYVLVGQTDTLAVYDVIVNGDTAYVPYIPVTSLNSGLIQNVSVYTATGMIGGPTVFTGDTAKVFIGYTFQPGTTKLYVMGTIRQITTSSQSGVNVKTSISNIEYHVATGQVKFAPNIMTGSDLYTTKALLEIVPLEVPSATIDTVNMMPIAHWKVTTVGGVSSWKQITFRPSFGDVGNNNSLSLNNFKFYEGPMAALVDRTSLVKFFDAAGQIDTSSTESDTELTLMWGSGVAEDLVTSTKEYWLFAKATGFTNGSDGFSLSYESDPSGGMNFRNLAPILGSLMAGLNNGSSTQKFNCLWSDRSEGAAHSANPELRKGGWKHGRFLKPFTFTQSFHQRQRP